MSPTSKRRKAPHSLLAAASALPALAPHALAAAMLLGPAAHAESGAADSDEPNAIEEMVVVDRAAEANPYAERGSPYKARRSGDHRRPALLADTPQTITVLTQVQLQDAGLSDLRDVLDSQPGITLGTGENGNAFGDRYIIRGHEARSDVWVDGLRDPGMTTRETFATEQIEITKGPSSTFAGRGSTGGAINGITKQASTLYDFSEVTGALGSDDYRRATIDWNERIDDTLALRANLLHTYQEVPDRGPAEKERTGALLSGSYEPNQALRVLADLYYLDADEVPDLGSYFDQATRTPVNDVPVYAQSNDFLESEVRTGTLRVAYAFDNGLRLNNALRYGETENGYVVTGARGATRAATDPVAPSARTITLSSHQGWQEVEYFAEQFTLGYDATLAGMKHQLVFGAEYIDERVANGVFTLANTGATNCLLPGNGTNPPQAGRCALDGNGNAVANLENLLGRTISRGAEDSDYQIDTISAYLMDTVSFSEHWQGFFGVRYDQFDYTNRLTAGNGTITEFEYDDGFWNGHAGIVYKPTDYANIYFTYSTSTNINGGESDLGGNCGYGGLCGTPDQVGASDPEQTENLELGAKVELFGDRLLIAAAVFQTTKDDVMESVGNAYSSLGTLNTGRNRVKGVEFSVVGNITNTLSTQFGATFMESEVLRSFDAASEGRVLSNFADDSVYLQVRWQATPALYVGGSVTYSSEMFAGQPDTAAGFNTTINEYSVEVPEYTVVDLFAGYEITDSLRARLNVTNLADKDYYVAAYRSGSFMYRGDARNAQLTLTYDF